jgi:hypothetical protein
LLVDVLEKVKEKPVFEDVKLNELAFMMAVMFCNNRNFLTVLQFGPHRARCQLSVHFVAICYDRKSEITAEIFVLWLFNNAVASTGGYLVSNKMRRHSIIIIIRNLEGGSRGLLERMTETMKQSGKLLQAPLCRYTNLISIK